MLARQVSSILTVLSLVSFLWQHIFGYFEPTYATDGFMLQNHVVETMPSAIKSFFGCYIKCEASVKCFSVNYFWGTMVCEFNNASHVSHPHDIIRTGNSSYLNTNKIPPYCTLNRSTALGMESDLIPDSAVTACSQVGFGYAAYRARLNHRPEVPYNKYKDTACWCSGSKAVGEYLQIDLGRLARVSMVASQGRPAWYQNQYVSKYRLAYNQGSSTWMDYMENNAIRVFLGNTHSEQVASNELKEKIELQLIRFIAVEWNNYICMRVEVYGCYLA